MSQNNPEGTLITSCKDCVFAIYVDNTQEACTFGVLDKVKHQPAYDEDKEFFVIPNFACQFQRKKEWAAGKTNIEEVVRKEIQLDYEVIAVGADPALIAHIAHLDIQPCYINVFVGVNENAIPVLDMLQVLGIPYTIHNLQGCDASAQDIDIYMLSCKSSCPWYYAVFKNPVNNSLLNKLNSEINEELNTYVYATDGDGQILMKHAHNAIGGISQVNSIPEKLCLRI